MPEAPRKRVGLAFLWAAALLGAFVFSAAGQNSARADDGTCSTLGGFTANICVKASLSTGRKITLVVTAKPTDYTSDCNGYNGVKDETDWQGKPTGFKGNNGYFLYGFEYSITGAGINYNNVYYSINQNFNTGSLSATITVTAPKSGTVSVGAQIRDQDRTHFCGVVNSGGARIKSAVTIPNPPSIALSGAISTDSRLRLNGTNKYDLATSDSGNDGGYKQINVKPGDTVYWNWTAKNNGGNASVAISNWVGWKKNNLKDAASTGISPGACGGKDGAVSEPCPYGTYNLNTGWTFNAGQNHNDNGSRVNESGNWGNRQISTAFVGKYLCEDIKASASNAGGSWNGDSENLCAYVLNWSVQTHNIAMAGDTATDVAAAKFPKNKSNLPFGNVADAYPGQYAAIGHYAQQNGPDSTFSKVSFSFDHTGGPTPAITGGKTAFDWGSTSASWGSGTGKSGVNYPGAPTVETNPNRITSDQAGDNFCSGFKADPWDAQNNTGSNPSTADGAYEGTEACVHVPYNYDVTLSGNGDLSTDAAGTQHCSDTTGVIGQTGSLTFRIAAASTEGGHNATYSKPIYFKVMNGSSVITSGVSATLDGGRQFPLGSNGVGTITDATHTSLGLAPGSEVTVSVAVSSNQVGQIVDYKLEISDDSKTWTGTGAEVSSDSQQSHGQGGDSCVDFAKRPELDLYGADSFAQAGFAGSGGLADSGSWSQYGLLSNGPITTFGSAGYTANSAATAKLGLANPLATCSLDFANTSGTPGNACTALGSDGSLGWERQLGLPDISRVPTPSQAGCTAYSDNAASAEYDQGGKACDLLKITPNGGTLKLSGDGAYEAMDRYLYVVGNVEILNSLTPATTRKYTDLSQVDSLTIIATGDIIVDPAATDIEANLVAGVDGSGAVKTCGASTAPDLTEAGACDRQLTIHGAVVSANSPRWQRTYGAELSGTGSPVSTPAEIVDYTPNLFLTPYSTRHESSKNSSPDWSVVNEISLPPRY